MCFIVWYIRSSFFVVVVNCILNMSINNQLICWQIQYCWSLINLYNTLCFNILKKVLSLCLWETINNKGVVIIHWPFYMCIKMSVIVTLVTFWFNMLPKSYQWEVPIRNELLFFIIISERGYFSRWVLASALNLSECESKRYCSLFFIGGTVKCVAGRGDSMEITRGEGW